MEYFQGVGIVFITAKEKAAPKDPHSLSASFENRREGVPGIP